MTRNASASRSAIKKTHMAIVSDKQRKGRRHSALAIPFALLLGALGCPTTPVHAATDCLVPGGWISYVAQGNVATMRPDGWHKKRLTQDGTSTWPTYSMNGCRILSASEQNAVDGNPHQVFNRLYLMRTSGARRTAITGSLQQVFHPRFNRAGTKIVYSQQLLFGTSRTYNALFISNANGSGVQELSDRDVHDPAWSWTGNGLVFTAGTTGDVEDPAFAQSPDVYVMTPVGGPLTRLTTNGAYDGEPELNASSTKIVFVSERNGNKEIYIMNRDGSAQTRLTQNAARDFSPVFSPDGTKIAWVSNRDGDNEIYVMNTDGSGQHKITNNSTNDHSPHWR